MSAEHGLSGNRLLVYALVCGMQNGEGFYGSLSFVSRMTGCSRETVCRMLAKMVREGILRKVVTTENGRKTVRYEALTKRQDHCQNVNEPLTKRQRTIDETSTGYNSNIIDDKKENIIKEKDDDKNEGANAYTEDFLNIFRLLGKGSKTRAWALWKKLTDEEIGRIKKHVGHYVSETARKYRFGLERYLSERTFDDPVYYDGMDKNVKRYDPNKENVGYEPGGDVVTDERGNHYLKYQWRQGITIIDGYDDDTRPDGAQLNMYGNWDYGVRWYANEKEWRAVSYE